MTTKTQTSTISFRTLRGVFEQPKMNHRRDFLRENKLSLRELQKNTNQKLTQKRQDHETRQNKYLHKFHKAPEQVLAFRTASQCEGIEQNSKRQARIARNLDGRGMSNGGGVNAALRKKSNYLADTRSYSQPGNKVNASQSESTCCVQHHQKQQLSENNYKERMRRSTSSASILSKAESFDKEIQTEDINDEHFLYEALKKCSSSEMNPLHKQKSVDQLNTITNNLQQHESELHSVHSREGIACASQCHCEHKKSQNEHILQYSPRPQVHTEEGALEKVGDENLDNNFRNLKLSNDMGRESELQLSARSRQTLCSTSTKRSVHKLGSREDIRLPNYLQREKREREEERLRELNKDLNCPFGHYALSEEERLKALNEAKEKMASLINELNHMPMTMETLRIRNRKVEIEKELTQIEFDIRLYSKPKVYIPKANLQYQHS